MIDDSKVVSLNSFHNFSSKLNFPFKSLGYNDFPFSFFRFGFFKRIVLNTLTMATRKSRMNTESPTPSSGSDTVPTTPTTLSARTRGRKLKTESDTPTTAVTDKTEEEEETVKSSQDEDSQMDMNEILNEVRKEAAKEVTTSVRKRRLAALKEDSTGDKPADKTSPTTVTPEKPRASTEPSADDKDNAASSSVFLAAKRPRRSAVENCVANKQPEKIGKRRNSTGGTGSTGVTSGKIEKPSRLSARIKLRQAKLKRSLLKKPTTISKPLRAALLNEKLDPKPIKKIKVEKNIDSASSDSELMKINRRRSDSVSKSSDMTDTSSFQETKDSEELATGLDATPQNIVIKTEVEDVKPADKETKADDSVHSSDAADVESPTSEGKSKEAETATSEDKRPVRRLRRNNFATLPPPKTISTRSRSETPVKNESTTSRTTEADDGGDEKEVVIKEEAPEPEQLDLPLHIETAAEKEKDSGDDAPMDEKSESLSPVLVSEGVSEISVKQFYGRPDFLENNLGIEEDPKLGEIVQVKEKIKQDDGVVAPVPVTLLDNNNDNKENEVQEAEVAEPETEVIEEKDETAISEAMKEVKEEKEETEEIEEIEQAEETSTGEKESDKAENDDESDETVDTAKLSNANRLILGSEIEVRPKDNSFASNKKSDNEDVVLFTITNGVRVNPEKLETVLENQKLKESTDDVVQITEAAETHSEKDAEEDAEMVEHSQTNGEEHASNDSKSSEEIISVADDDESEAKKADETEENSNKDEDETMEVGASEAEPTGDVAKADCTDNKDKSNSSTAQTPRAEPKAKHSKSKSDAGSEGRSPNTIRVAKEKESHLKTLGLLTHQEAVAVTIEKEKRRELRKSSASTTSSTSSNGKGKKNSEYTGTLKTVIKLHRTSNNDRKKGRMPLKMTLHKGKGKNGNGMDRDGSAGNSDEDTYYTIHNEVINSIGNRMSRDSPTRIRQFHNLLTDFPFSPFLIENRWTTIQVTVGIVEKHIIDLIQLVCALSILSLF